MSTTEHLPTTEHDSNFRQRFEQTCKEIHSRIVPYSYPIPLPMNNILSVFAPISYSTFDKKYNTVVANICETLSRNYRWKISRSCDAVRNFTVAIYPGEKLESASLFCYDDKPSNYKLLKTVFPETNTFSFFGNTPLVNLDFFKSCSIEVKISGVKYEHNRNILIEVFTFTDGFRKDIIEKIMENEEKWF